MPAQFAPIDQADLVAGYKRASSVSPISAAELNKVYAEYGLQAGKVQGKTDSFLRRRAAKAVVNWWNKQQVTPATPSDTPAGTGATGGSGSTTPTPPPTTAPATPKPPVIQPTTYPAQTSNLIPPLTTAQIKATLTSAGIPNASPPSYATTSQTALDAWIKRVFANQALAIAKLKAAPTTTTTIVAPRTADSRVLEDVG